MRQKEGMIDFDLIEVMRSWARLDEASRPGRLSREEDSTNFLFNLTIYIFLF